MNTYDQSDLLTEFPLFNKFPIEIKLKVWKAASNNIPPRLVRIVRKFRGSAIPNVLQVCSASRSEAMLRYKRFELSPWPGHHTDPAIPPHPIYAFFYDCERDILDLCLSDMFFHDHHTHYHYRQGDQENRPVWNITGPTDLVRRIMVSSSITIRPYSQACGLGFYIMMNKRLASLTVEKLPELLIPINPFTALPSGDTIALRTVHEVDLEGKEKEDDTIAETQRYIDEAKISLTNIELRGIAMRHVRAMLAGRDEQRENANFWQVLTFVRFVGGFA